MFYDLILIQRKDISVKRQVRDRFLIKQSEMDRKQIAQQALQIKGKGDLLIYST